MGRWVRQKKVGVLLVKTQFNFYKRYNGPMKETSVNEKMEGDLFGRM